MSWDKTAAHKPTPQLRKPIQFQRHAAMLCDCVDQTSGQHCPYFLLHHNKHVILLVHVWAWHKYKHLLLAPKRRSREIPNIIPQYACTSDEDVCPKETPNYFRTSRHRVTLWTELNELTFTWRVVAHGHFSSMFDLWTNGSKFTQLRREDFSCYRLAPKPVRRGQVNRPSHMGCHVTSEILDLVTARRVSAEVMFPLNDQLLRKKIAPYHVSWDERYVNWNVYF